MTAGAGVALVTCQPDFIFYDLCRAISAHDPTGFAGPVTSHAIGAIGSFLLVYLVGRLLRRAADAALVRGKADRQVRTLLHNVMTAVIYLAAVLTAVVVAGVNIAVLLTAAGVSTVAIGLAFQDILRNILAGIWLLLERPFRLGDNITVSEQSGVVQTITLRTTTLKTADGRLAVVPNLTAFTNPVLNASTFQLRRFAVSVRIGEDADLESVLRAARTALQKAPDLASRPAPAVSPQLDGEFLLVRCTYWMDQASHNPDAVAADVVRRVWGAVHSAASSS
ncbi:MAG TPA: mechanosensitive ion channel domain-containing protein [Candidatus Dormibacteraeota bacterium]